jgi:hypothetical protein
MYIKSVSIGIMCLLDGSRGALPRRRVGVAVRRASQSLHGVHIGSDASVVACVAAKTNGVGRQRLAITARRFAPRVMVAVAEGMIRPHSVHAHCSMVAGGRQEGMVVVL